MSISPASLRGREVPTVLDFDELEPWREAAAGLLALPGPRFVVLHVEPVGPDYQFPTPEPIGGPHQPASARHCNQSGSDPMAFTAACRLAACFSAAITSRHLFPDQPVILHDADGIGRRLSFFHERPAVELRPFSADRTVAARGSC